MTTSYYHQNFASPDRVSQALSNDRCQTILYKAVFEHFVELHHIAALLLTSKSFQNSSFGANFLVNYVVDENSIVLLEAVLSPSSCFSLQFAPSLHIKGPNIYSENMNEGISNFVGELFKTKYLGVSLRSLSLDSATQEDVSCFFGSSTSNAWPQLQDLALESCELNDSVLEIISKNAPQLREVNFSESSGVADSGLEHLSKLSSITFLDLTWCVDITDAGLEPIAELPNIVALSLSGCDNVTDASLQLVAKMSGITFLDLAYITKITDAGLDQIAVLTSITTLRLAGCNLITDDGLGHISKIAGITSLDLYNCFFITDVGLQHACKLSGIRLLSLSCCNKITDVGLEHLSNLSSITWLDLSLSREITDVGLEFISELSSITYLNLYGCGEITDVGLEHLVKLAGIASLNLSSCSNVTAEAKTKFKSTLRNCDIIG